MKEIKRAILTLKCLSLMSYINTKELMDDLNLAISTLEKQLNNGWIPVSERLPKYDGSYYCTVKVKDGIKGMQAGAVVGMECVYVSGTWKNVWFQEISHIFDVIAWQSLPEPYKEVE